MGPATGDDHQRRGDQAQEHDPHRERQAVAAQRELAREEAVLAQDRGEARERGEARVRGEEQQQRRERLEQIERQRPGPEHGRRDLGDHGLVLDVRAVDLGNGRIDREVRREERDADEQDRQDGGHDEEGRRGVLGFGRLECRHAGRDRFRTRQRHGARCEGPQQQEDRHRTGRACRGLHDLRGWRVVLAEDDDPVRPDGDHREGAEHEEVRRDRKDVAGFTHAAKVGDRDEPECRDADAGPAHRREPGTPTRSARPQTTSRRPAVRFVVDEQRRRRDQRGVGDRSWPSRRSTSRHLSGRRCRPDGS